MNIRLMRADELGVGDVIAVKRSYPKPNGEWYDRMTVQMIQPDPANRFITARSIHGAALHRQRYTNDELVNVTGPTATVVEQREQLRAYVLLLERMAERQVERLVDAEVRPDVRDLLDALTDDEPCALDHHGTCQTHLAGEINGECANVVARRLIDAGRVPVHLLATCTRCGESFVPADEQDLVHLVREDGEECGGRGELES